MAEKLGDLLKRSRKEKNFTLRAVQERTGISNAYLSQIENAKIRSPSPNVLFKLAKLFGLSYERLLSLADHPLPIKNESIGYSRLQESLENLSEEEKERVFEYIKFLKSRKG